MPNGTAIPSASCNPHCPGTGTADEHRRVAAPHKDPGRPRGRSAGILARPAPCSAARGSGAASGVPLITSSATPHSVSAMPSARTYDRRLAALVNRQSTGALQGGLKGVEKESLRVTPRGLIAPTPHPRALGSALTNEHITTDYSEALIELVTPPFAADLGTRAVPLRPAPVRLPAPATTNCSGRPACPAPSRATRASRSPSIGSSNVGRMKTVYRRRARPPLRARDAGHLRRALQLLVPRALLAGAGGPAASATTRGQAFRSDSYFSLLRNYRRHGWIVLYLFGNSPALCPSFLQGRKVDWLEDARARQPVRAVRHLAAHERPRLPQQEPGGARGLGQQPRALRARPDARRSARRIPSTRRSASRWTASTGS